MGNANLRSVARGRWGPSRCGGTLFGNAGIHSEDRVDRAEKDVFLNKNWSAQFENDHRLRARGDFLRMQLLHVVRFNGA